MPRALGQIDPRKTEAILDAAQAAFSERGFGASLDEIARRAGVSKQTIYNHCGSKADLLWMIIDRRRAGLTALLEAPGAKGRLEETLTAYATRLLELHVDRRTSDLIRLAIATAAEEPEIGRMIYEAGVRAGRGRLAAFLRRESEAGRLKIDDPDGAAEMFAGMVNGHTQMRALLGVGETKSPADLERKAQEAVQRFLRAFRPVANA